jgi:hypothetical protein
MTTIPAIRIGSIPATTAMSDTVNHMNRSVPQAARPDDKPRLCGVDVIVNHWIDAHGNFGRQMTAPAGLMQGLNPGMRRMTPELNRS